MTVQQKPKRQHHTVWQQYLKPWTNSCVIWCLQNGRIFSTGTPVLAVEKDFYKLHKLAPEDFVFIKTFLDSRHPLAKRNHLQLLNMLMFPFHIAEQMQHSPHRAAIDQYLEGYESGALEDYHASIEASFVPHLERALKGDISFYSDDQQCMTFLNYLCTQYMRTKGIKDRAIERCNANKTIDLSRLWNVMIHMIASDIGASLFQGRGRQKLVFVHNRTDVPFITGDQPVINLNATPPNPPESFSLYYPISPQLALLLPDVDEEPLFSTEGLTPAQASVLNSKLFEACHKQVFAQSEESLSMLRR